MTYRPCSLCPDGTVLGCVRCGARFGHAHVAVIGRDGETATLVPLCGAHIPRYEADRKRDTMYGRPRTVDAEPVREHVRSLMCRGKRGSHHEGVGLKQIAKVTGVAHGTLWKLMYGAPDRKGPSRKVRRATANKILAVTRDDMADGATVPAGRTLKRLDAMVEGGFAKAEIGRYLTGNPRTCSLQVARNGRVTVANERKVADLYRRWRAGEIVPRGKRTRHHDHGVPPTVPMLAVSEIVRPSCEDCGAQSLAGGRWCWPCFRARTEVAA